MPPSAESVGRDEGELAFPRLPDFATSLRMAAVGLQWHSDHDISLTGHICKMLNWGNRMAISFLPEEDGRGQSRTIPHSKPGCELCARTGATDSVKPRLHFHIPYANVGSGRVCLQITPSITE